MSSTSSPQSPPPQDHTATLRQCMAQVGLSSFRALSQQAAVPRSQLQKLRQGQIQQLPFGSLLRLAQTLNLTIDQLHQHFDATAKPASGVAPSPNPISAPQATASTSSPESANLGPLLEPWQRQSLITLEPLLRYWPTIAQAAGQDPALPAQKLLPFLRALETLLQSWDAQPLAPIGDTVAYDPQQHQLLKGTAEPGALVRVRYQGYTHHGKLLFRAQVSP